MIIINGNKLILYLIGDGTDIKWVSTMFAWIGKFSTAGCWSVVFLYASEIYPTVIRSFIRKSSM